MPDSNRQQGLVSIIMNCLNCEKYLKEAIDSVYAQTYANWEIIFWDNDSTDKSAEIALSYDERLRYFKSEKTLPLSQARNKAINEARGDYIAFLDCDDMWLPEKLDKQVNLITGAGKDTDKPGICYTEAMRVDKYGNDLLPFSHKRSLATGDIYGELIKDCFIAMSSFIVPKDVFQTSGLFNSRYHLVEEWDLFLRIAKDYNALCVEEFLTKVRIHDDNISKDITLSLSESYDLISQLSVRAGYLKDLKKRKLKELKFRIGLSKILNKKNSTAYTRLKDILDFGLMFFYEPVASFSFLLKFFNIGYYKLYRTKYRNAT